MDQVVKQKIEDELRRISAVWRDLSVVCRWASRSRDTAYRVWRIEIGGYVALELTVLPNPDWERDIHGRDGHEKVVNLFYLLAENFPTGGQDGMTFSS